MWYKNVSTISIHFSPMLFVRSRAYISTFFVEMSLCNLGLYHGTQKFATLRDKYFKFGVYYVTCIETVVGKQYTKLLYNIMQMLNSM